MYFINADIYGGCFFCFFFFFLFLFVVELCPYPLLFSFFSSFLFSYFFCLFLSFFWYLSLVVDFLSLLMKWKVSKGKEKKAENTNSLAVPSSDKSRNSLSETPRKNPEMEQETFTTTIQRAVTSPSTAPAAGEVLLFILFFFFFFEMFK